MAVSRAILDGASADTGLIQPLTQPEPMQDLCTVRKQIDAHTQWLWFGNGLEDVDVVSLSLEAQRRRQPTDPAPDDRDAQLAGSGRQRELTSTGSSPSTTRALTRSCSPKPSVNVS
jgi:hypothetical protein